jgi:hypothetical protein
MSTKRQSTKRRPRESYTQIPSLVRRGNGSRWNARERFLNGPGDVVAI